MTALRSEKRQYAEAVAEVTSRTDSVAAVIESQPAALTMLISVMAKLLQTRTL